MSIRRNLRNPGIRWWMASLLVALVTTAPQPLMAQESEIQADAVLDRAIALMGGAETLRNIERVRFDFTTQWQRIGFRDIPWNDRPSFETHIDVRDYSIRGWRNTREFPQRSIVNIVRDSVAITDAGSGFVPQSVAYVDERDELFLYTPDRLVIGLSESADRRLEADTLIGGEPHHVIAATVSTGQRVRTYFHAGSGLPTLLHFRAAHPNDFGLVPWGEMHVHVWYSGWRSFGEVNLPTQWDILRVGRPYKRMTVRRAVFNPEFAPDSFAVTKALRDEFVATRGPMHDRPADSIVVLHPDLVAVHGFGYPAGAVRTDAGWVLLEGGQHPLVYQRAFAALNAHAGVDRLAGAILATARTGNGAVTAMVDDGIRLLVAPAAEPFVRTMLLNAGKSQDGVEVVKAGGEI